MAAGSTDVFSTNQMPQSSLRRWRPCWPACVLLLCSLGGLVVGCVGTDTGNPFSQPLTVDAHSTDSTIVEIGGGSGNYVTQAWVGLGAAVLRGCGESAPLQPLANVGIGDHAAVDALNLLVSIDAGIYCGIDTPFVVADTDVPPEVEGHSVYLRGYTDADVPFIIASQRFPNVVLTGDDEFELAPTLGALYLGFNLSTWMSAVRFDDAVIDSQGVIVIRTGSNEMLLQAFEDSLASGLELYRDSDGDGILDGPEALLAAGQ